LNIVDLQAKYFRYPQIRPHSADSDHFLCNLSLRFVVDLGGLQTGLAPVAPIDFFRADLLTTSTSLCTLISAHSNRSRVKVSLFLTFLKLDKPFLGKTGARVDFLWHLSKKATQKKLPKSNRLTCCTR
jgi:hypothetical protein